MAMLSNVEYGFEEIHFLSDKAFENLKKLKPEYFLIGFYWGFGGFHDYIMLQ